MAPYGPGNPRFVHLMKSPRPLLTPRLLNFAILLWMAVVSAAVNVNVCRAQNGDLDVGFNPQLGQFSAVQAQVRQPDGKLLITGSFTAVNATARGGIARLNADGTVDAAFNPGGSGANSVVNTVALQADNKILIGGDFTTYNNVARARFARLNPDGTLDPTFNPAGGADAAVLAVAFQLDSKVLIAGEFTQVNGAPRNRLARLNPDGTLDTAYNPNANSTVRALALQTDGKALVGGSFTNVAATALNRVARLNADGTADATYLIGTGANSTVRTLAVQADGKLVLGGSFTQFNATTRNRIARLNVNGNLDPTFDPNANAAVYSLAVQPDTRVVVGGDFTTIAGQPRTRIARLNADGTADGTFTVGTGADGRVQSLALQADGSVFIGGTFNAINGANRSSLARLNPSGILDASFAAVSVTQPSGYVYSLLRQSDGKLLIGGYFDTVNGTVRHNLARLNADGTLDPTFATGNGPNYIVLTIALQADNKVLIGGFFDTVNGVTRHGIARLDATGALDLGFTADLGLFGYAYAVVLQPATSQIVAGGNFTQASGVAVNDLARFNADGTFDATFMTGTGPDNQVLSLLVQADGRLLAGGYFQNFNGVPRNRLVRLNANGSFDATLNLGTGADSFVYTLAQQTDGRLLVGGDFATFNAVASRGVVRLNLDGTVDGTFAVGTGADSTVYALTVQPDNTVLLGGNFSTFNGVMSPGLVRVQANGGPDAAFNPGAGVTGQVLSLALQPEGKAFVGGFFSAYNNVARTGLARVNTFPPPPVTGPAVPEVAVNGAGATRGGFVLTRNGGQVGQTLTLACHNGGSAAAGTDYVALPTSVTFPAGATEVVVPVQLLPGANRMKKVKLFIDPSASGNYTITKFQSKVFLSDLP